MMFRRCAVHRLPQLALASLLSLLALAPTAHADGPRLQSGPVLPASSWRRLMDGLEQHFGTDASLDAATTRQIGDWLQQHAATGGRTAQAPPQDRITRSSWFERKHRKIDPAVWQHASVKSAANCAACHAGAAQGDFDDDRIQVPPGLDTRHQRAFQDD